MYCVFLGRATATNAPGAGSVGTAQLAADAVTNAKIADDAISDEQLDPTVITGQTAETSIATDDLILLSDTSASGALKKMTRANFVSGVGITGLGVANSWYLSSSWSGNANTDTLITPFAQQTAGTSSNFSHSSGTFTAPSTGIYYVHSSFAAYKASGTFFRYIASRIYLGGTQKAMTQTMLGSEGAGNRWVQCHCTAIVDITNTSTDTIKFYLNPDQASINIENGITSQVHFIKLAET
jgi:hypothetical protein